MRTIPARNGHSPRLWMMAAMLLAVVGLLWTFVPLNLVEASGQNASSTAIAPLKPWFVPVPEIVAPEADSIPLDRYIETQLARAHMAGLSAAIVKNGQVVWIWELSSPAVDHLWLAIEIAGRDRKEEIAVVPHGGVHAEADVHTRA